jgi:hypothetical protein
MLSKCPIEAEQFRMNFCSCISVLVCERTNGIDVKPIFVQDIEFG